MSSYALEVQNLHSHFQMKPFFQGVSFQLERGKIHDLKGKNGSGKSTLLSLLQGNISHSCQGELIINQQTFKLPTNCLKQHIALVNQRFDTMIADQFTFDENLQFALLPTCPSPFSFLHQAHPLPQFIDHFGINRSIPARYLSGGQRQILALCMILQRQPSLLFLDEPTATLDPENARLVFDFLRELARDQKMTILVISHDRELVDEYIDGARLDLIINNQGIRTIHH